MSAALSNRWATRGFYTLYAASGTARVRLSAQASLARTVRSACSRTRPLHSPTARFAAGRRDQGGPLFNRQNWPTFRPALTSRSPSLAERLAQFYREGERLRRQLWIDLRSRETFDESRDEGQTERHRSVRAWNQAVTSCLYGDEGSEFKQQWDAVGSIPDPHPTLALVEPTISFGELIRFMDDKLACLKEIIKALGVPSAGPGDGA